MDDVVALSRLIESDNGEEKDWDSVEGLRPRFNAPRSAYCETGPISDATTLFCMPLTLRIKGNSDATFVSHPSA